MEHIDEDLMSEPLSYEAQKQVFQYLPMEIRKNFRKNCFSSEAQMSKRTFDDSLPYMFQELHVTTQYPNKILIKVTTSDHSQYSTWMFLEKKIVVKTLAPDGTVLAEEGHVGKGLAEENSKQWIEFYLNRPNTSIYYWTLRYLPPQIILMHSIRVSWFMLSVECLPNMENPILNILKPSIRWLYLNRYRNEYARNPALQSAKEVEFRVDSFENLSQIYFPLCRFVKFRAKSSFSKDETLDFLKKFSLENQSKIPKLIFANVDISLIEEVIRSVRNDSMFEKKYLGNKACATLQKEDYEINIFSKFDEILLQKMNTGSATTELHGPKAMPFILAAKVFERLSISTRKEIHEKTNFDFSYYASLKAENVLLKCERGSIVEATVDGSTVFCSHIVMNYLKKNSFIVNLIIEGVWSEIYIFVKLQVTNLTLRSDAAFPIEFFEKFKRTYPVSLTANSRETVKNGIELVRNARVVRYTNETDDEIGEPSAKKPRLD